VKLETLSVHAGREPDAATGAVREPIQLSTTFERGDVRDAQQGIRWRLEPEQARRHCQGL